MRKISSLLVLCVLLVAVVSFAAVPKTLRFTWVQDDFDNLDHWELFMRIDNAQYPETCVFSIPYVVGETNFVSDFDIVVPNGTHIYYFVMKAVSAAGEASDPSNEVSQEFTFKISAPHSLIIQIVGE